MAEGAAEPDHYWLSTLPADVTLERMVDQAKLRWRIERDYLELKQEVGLGHYEGRDWRGFHTANTKAASTVSSSEQSSTMMISNDRVGSASWIERRHL